MKPLTTKPPIQDLSVGTFREEVLENSMPILIDFWAPWCPPCRALKPVLDEAAKMLEGKVRIAKVNVDEEPQLSAAFGIQSIPTLVLMKGDRALGVFQGFMPANTLVKQVLAKIPVE